MACLELGHNRAKGIVLIEPMGKEMHPHTRQMRCDLDDRGARTSGLPSMRFDEGVPFSYSGATLPVAD